MCASFKPVEDRFDSDRTPGEQVAWTCWRSDMIGRIDHETRGCLDLGRRSDYERKQLEGYYYPGIPMAEEGDTFERAAMKCLRRDSSSY